MRKQLSSFQLVASIAALFALSGCVETTGGGGAPASTATPAVQISGNGTEVQRFKRVVTRMEPIAERICRDRVQSGVNCDFKIVLDENPRAPSNAYQSQDKSGRPVLTFTAAILADFQNDDEMAFVLGHEAAHHISGHIRQTVQSATLGALAGGTLAVLLGGGQAAVDLGTDLGGSVGARAFSKEHELEADSLGARITQSAGYNAVRGAAFFQRIPDPGDRFLGSHPPNAQRIDIVRRTVGG